MTRQSPSRATARASSNQVLRVVAVRSASIKRSAFFQISSAEFMGYLLPHFSFADNCLH